MTDVPTSVKKELGRKATMPKEFLFFDNELEQETSASLDGLKMSDKSSTWGHHDIPTKENVYQDSSDDDLESSSSEEVSLGNISSVDL